MNCVLQFLIGPKIITTQNACEARVTKKSSQLIDIQMYKHIKSTQIEDDRTYEKHIF
jgi:hypothetical protein